MNELILYRWINQVKIPIIKRYYTYLDVISTVFAKWVILLSNPLEVHSKFAMP